MSVQLVSHAGACVWRPLPCGQVTPYRAAQLAARRSRPGRKRASPPFRVTVVAAGACGTVTAIPPTVSRVEWAVVQASGTRAPRCSLARSTSFLSAAAAMRWQERSTFRFNGTTTDMAMKKAKRSPVRRRKAIMRLAKRGAAGRAPKRIAQGCLSMTTKVEVIAYRDGKMGAGPRSRLAVGFAAVR